MVFQTKRGAEKMSHREESIARVLEMVREQRCSQVKFFFSDILGILKKFTIPVEELELAFKEGDGFDGSSIHGFARIDESDMIALPDPDTFKILPWEVGGEKTALVFCDILNPDRSPYLADSRYILKRALEKSKAMGFDHFYVGPEAEYFYFRKSEQNNHTDVLDVGGYFDTIDNGDEIRTYTVKLLKELGIDVEYHHHEVAPSQHEIDLRYKGALEMADQIMLHRWVVKEVAKKLGAYATFMPKPLFGENGSGMHTHQSLFKGEKNAFFDAEDPRYHLTQTARHYIAGILKYIPEVTLVLNQWVNSYKRLVPGFEAPVYLTWAIRNRSDLIRVPEYKPGHEKATRIEVRSPDPACNPYLAFSVMLIAGLKGIEEKLDPPEPVEVNVYEMSQKERENRGIGTLPNTLERAMDLAEKSEIFWEAVGPHIGAKLLESKRREWDNYRIQVHPYEIERYLPKL